MAAGEPNIRPPKKPKQAILVLAMIIGLVSAIALLIMLQKSTKEPMVLPKMEGQLITTVFGQQYACEEISYSDIFMKGFTCIDKDIHRTPIDEVWIRHENIRDILVWREE